MIKLELIRALKKETKLNKIDARNVVEIFFEEMAEALANGDKVEIRGLFSFYVKHYKAYIGRKPKTSEQVKVKPKKLPVFRVGKELKRRVDYQR
ncbi:MAG: HU family DNA-binding protein [Desulfobacterales bacterium]|nr:HU family DNA-binding protein [Desulfobacterales bacterium]